MDHKDVGRGDRHVLEVLLSVLLGRLRVGAAIPDIEGEMVGEDFH